MLSVTSSFSIANASISMTGTFLHYSFDETSLSATYTGPSLTMSTMCGDPLCVLCSSFSPDECTGESGDTEECRGKNEQNSLHMGSFMSYSGDIYSTKIDKVESSDESSDSQENDEDNLVVLPWYVSPFEIEICS